MVSEETPLETKDKKVVKKEEVNIDGKTLDEDKSIQDTAKKNQVKNELPPNIINETGEDIIVRTVESEEE